MSKTIKVSDEIYQEIQDEQRPRESMSQVLDRIFHVYRQIKTVSETLGPRHPLNHPELARGGRQ